MLSALALAAALHAAELPTPEEVTARHPYALRVIGDDERFAVRDLDGKALSTPHTLLLAGLPDAAEAYERGVRTRKAVSLGLWIGGSALAVGGSLLAGTTGESELLALQVLGLGAVGAGFPVRFVNPKRRVSAWVDRATVEAAVQAHNAVYAAPVTTPDVVVAREAALAQRMFYVDYDGVLVDADREPVRMRDLLRVVEDPSTEERYRATRRQDKTIWITTASVGGGLAVLGGGTALIGLLVVVLGGPTDTLEIGGGLAALGLVGVGTGVTGSVISRIRHEDPAFWYDEPSMRSVLDGYEQNLRQDLGLPARGAFYLEVQPLVGPGVVGLTGTF